MERVSYWKDDGVPEQGAAAAGRRGRAGRGVNWQRGTTEFRGAVLGSRDDRGLRGSLVIEAESYRGCGMEQDSYRKDKVVWRRGRYDEGVLEQGGATTGRRGRIGSGTRWQRGATEFLGGFRGYRGDKGPRGSLAFESGSYRYCRMENVSCRNEELVWTSVRSGEGILEPGAASDFAYGRRGGTGRGVKRQTRGTRFLGDRGGAGDDTGPPGTLAIEAGSYGGCGMEHIRCQKEDLVSRRESSGEGDLEQGAAASGRRGWTGRGQRRPQGAMQFPGDTGNDTGPQGRRANEAGSYGGSRREDLDCRRPCPGEGVLEHGAAAAGRGGRTRRGWGRQRGARWSQSDVGGSQGRRANEAGSYGGSRREDLDCRRPCPGEGILEHGAAAAGRGGQTRRGCGRQRGARWSQSDVGGSQGKENNGWSAERKNKQNQGTKIGKRRQNKHSRSERENRDDMPERQELPRKTWEQEANNKETHNKMMPQRCRESLGRWEGTEELKGKGKEYEEKSRIIVEEPEDQPPQRLTKEWKLQKENKEKRLEAQRREWELGGQQWEDEEEINSDGKDEELEWWKREGELQRRGREGAVEMWGRKSVVEMWGSEWVLKRCGREGELQSWGREGELERREEELQRREKELERRRKEEELERREEELQRQEEELERERREEELERQRREEELKRKRREEELKRKRREEELERKRREEELVKQRREEELERKRREEELERQRREEELERREVELERRRSEEELERREEALRMREEELERRRREEERNRQAIERITAKFTLFKDDFPEKLNFLKDHVVALFTVANEIDQDHKSATLAGCAGAGLSVAGGIAALSGAALAPFTGGASLVATVGVGGSILGGITRVVGGVKEKMDNTKSGNTVDEIVKCCQKVLKELEDVYDEIQNDIRVLEDGELTEKYSVTLDEIKYSFSLFGPALKTEMFEGTLTSITQLTARLLYKVVAENVSQVAAKEVAKQVSQKTTKYFSFEAIKEFLLFSGTNVSKSWYQDLARTSTVASGAVAAIFLPFDAKDLYEETTHLSEGAKSKIAEEIRNTAMRLMELIACCTNALNIG